MGANTNIPSVILKLNCH